MIDPTSPAVVVLRRGDKVLLALHYDPTPDEAQEQLRALTRVFPGVEFVILANCAGLLVQPGDRRPEDAPG